MQSDMYADEKKSKNDKFSSFLQVSGSQVSGAQDSTSGLTNNCGCNNISNLQEMAPTDAVETNHPASGEGSPVGGEGNPVDAASSPNSRK